MSENLLSKLTSYSWLKMAISARWNDLINSINFKPYIVARDVAGAHFRFYIGMQEERVGMVVL
jgi:hypothetical protein